MYKKITQKQVEIAKILGGFQPNIIRMEKRQPVGKVNSQRI